MTQEDLNKVLELARYVKSKANEQDSSDVSRLMMDTFVGGSFEAGIVMACYEIIRRTSGDLHDTKYNSMNLLERVQQLQKENEELGKILQEKDATITELRNRRYVIKMENQKANL